MWERMLNQLRNSRLVRDDDDGTFNCRKLRKSSEISFSLLWVVAAVFAMYLEFTPWNLRIIEWIKFKFLISSPSPRSECKKRTAPATHTHASVPNNNEIFFFRNLTRLSSSFFRLSPTYYMHRLIIIIIIINLSQLKFNILPHLYCCEGSFIQRILTKKIPNTQ